MAAPEDAKRRFSVGALLGAVLASAALSSVASIAVLRARATDAGARSVAATHVYQCPMHPSIVQDHPGNCPICGMKLVRVERSSAPPAPSTSAAATPASVAPVVPGLARVEIDAARQQLIGLKTAEVAVGSVGGALRTVGRVVMDETRVRRVNVKVSGFVERVYVDYVGKKVRRGDPLFSIYSPELLSAQEEYLLALRTRAELVKVGAAGQREESGLLAAARRKLELWDVPASVLDSLEATRQPTKTLTLHSPVSGVVTRKDVVQGAKLDAGATPYEIVDLSTVWLLADVYESELRFVKQGMAAKLTLTAFPNREFVGKVVFLDPLLDPQTRTVKVRLTFPNASGELRPEMFGEVVLLGAPRQGLRVPSDAVIDSGLEKVVFVAVGEGKFEPRRVELGESDGVNVEVVSGLQAGERVVVRANFLVDSESRLRASLADIAPRPSAAAGRESARVLPASATPSAPAPSAVAPAAPSGVHEHSGHGR